VSLGHTSEGIALPFPIEEKLVIAVASSALFDLAESDAVFRQQGLEAYRAHQRANESVILPPGVAFPLVRRLLALNGQEQDDSPVEVILLSRNDPDTGSRVFRSIAHYGLAITRAAFVNGRTPFRYLKAFNAALFLSGNPNDVRQAVSRGAPAGQVLPTDFVDDHSDAELRVAFDFDGILADDSAEAIFQSEGLEAFQAAEAAAASVPMPRGPLARFFIEIAKLQRREFAKRAADETYEPRLRVAIITARNAPAHERLVTTLRDWGIEVDEVFFLGGIEKRRILEEFRPHIFFDDTVGHVERARRTVPCVHVPFGIANEPLEAAVIEEAQAENAKRSTR
jgi:5'-nucleotidase